MKDKKSNGINVLTLTVMNIAAVVSLKGLASEASYGLSAIFYYLFAAIMFLIPVSLISAELAAGFPEEKGGVYVWVREAFGKRLGFLAIWLQWIQNTIWFPTVLTFSAVSIAFIGANPNSSNVALANNKLYVAIVCFVIYWGATLVNLKGISASSKISKIGGLIGTIIPAILLILLAGAWLFSGKPLEMNTNIHTLVPNLSNINNLVLASSIFLYFAGMELSSVHVTEIKNPQKNYPKAIILASIISVTIFILGTLAISFVLPSNSINLTQGLFIAFDKYLTTFHLGFLSPIIFTMLVIGVIAGVSTWIGGPSKGLLTVGHQGMLPPFLQKTNKNGIQINILLVQGFIVSILILLFTFMPSIQSVYQVLTQLTSILYLVMYMLLFLSGIKLRIKYPNMKREFSIPMGKMGMFLLGGLGMFSALLAFILSFMPPSQIQIGSTLNWYLILGIGFVVFITIPLIIYQCRKPNWIQNNKTDNNFNTKGDVK